MKNLSFGGEALVIGRNSIEYLKGINNKKVFIVTGGKSMINNGTINKIDDILINNNCETYIHTGVKANPDTEEVEAGLGLINNFKPDILIAVGGGSPIDVGKILALLYEYPEINFNNILKIKLPEKRKVIDLIAIPSTSGTGSEVTKAAVITFRKQNIKIGIKCGALVPDVAILDPEITMTMPDKITAETGMDALTHAVESYINKNKDDFTECIAKGAVQGIFKYLPVSYDEKTIESREKMHNYQCMAGLAFANSGLGMAHGIAHAIGGKFDLGHGLANAIVLPYVLKFNSRDPEVSIRLEQLSFEIGNSNFIQSVVDLNEKLNIPKSFKEAGILESDFYDNFDVLVENSLLGSTLVNPVKISRQEMAELLKEIFIGSSN
jgi:alcohol dehydrogenase class IV